MFPQRVRTVYGNNSNDVRMRLKKNTVWWATVKDICLTSIIMWTVRLFHAPSVNALQSFSSPGVSRIVILSDLKWSSHWRTSAGLNFTWKSLEIVPNLQSTHTKCNCTPYAGISSSHQHNPHIQENLCPLSSFIWIHLNTSFKKLRIGWAKRKTWM